MCLMTEDPGACAHISLGIQLGKAATSAKARGCFSFSASPVKFVFEGTRWDYILFFLALYEIRSDSTTLAAGKESSGLCVGTGTRSSPLPAGRKSLK